MKAWLAGGWQPQGPDCRRPWGPQGSHGTPGGSVAAPVLGAGERAGPAGADDGGATAERVSPGQLGLVVGP